MNCTHLVRPVDHRVAAWIKKCLHTLFLEEETLMHDVWANYRENKSMCSQYLRVTQLKWVNASWDQLKRQDNLLRLAFTSTGCLITLTGKHAMSFRDIAEYPFEYPHPAEASSSSSSSS